MFPVFCSGEKVLRMPGIEPSTFPRVKDISFRRKPFVSLTKGPMTLYIKHHAKT